MVQFLSWQDGKKTYLTVAVGIAVAVAQYCGVHIPSYVDWALGFLGLGFGRLAVAKQSRLTADVLRAITDAAVVVDDIKPMITKDDTAKSAPVDTVTVTTLPPVK